MAAALHMQEIGRMLIAISLAWLLATPFVFFRDTIRIVRRWISASRKGRRS
jgi:hypothetical protein